MSASWAAHVAWMVGSAAGLCFGAAAARSARILGTVLMCAPVAAWFVLLVLTERIGAEDAATRTSATALLGVLMGLFVGRALFRRRIDERDRG